MEQLKEYLEKLESADMTAAFCIDGEEEIVLNELIYR